MSGLVARLRLTDVHKRFGATQALGGVTLEIAPGEIHALIGENGAGKSTLMKVLSGAHRPDSGELHLDAEPYAPADPLDARRRGVAMIYQELNLALHLTVAENILLGSEPARLGWINRSAMRAQARSALAQLGYADLDLDQPAGTLSIATQQIVEIARALLARPRVLILDEPTSSLTAADTERLFAAMQTLRAQGVALIYISHFLEECRRIADRFTVLKDGRTVGTGAMADATVDRIVTLMTGREVTALYPRSEKASLETAAVVLDVRTVAAAPRLTEATFQLRAGEVFGLAGLIGAGRTELLRSIFGLDPMDAGTVAVMGATDAPADPAGRWGQSLGFLSENRKEEGLMLVRSIADNLTMTALGRYGRFGWIDRRRQNEAARHWIGELGVRCIGPEQAIGELSGGNQQKVALARLLEHPARILLLDEPTRGIDVGSKAQIYALIGQLAAAGRSVVLVSSYLPELLGLCDTIGVMCRGRLAAVRPRSAWTEASIMKVATGSDSPSP